MSHFHSICRRYVLDLRLRAETFTAHQLRPTSRRWFPPYQRDVTRNLYTCLGSLEENRSRTAPTDPFGVGVDRKSLRR